MEKQINIRVAVEEDSATMLEIQKEVLAEEDFLITTFEEFQRSIDEQKQWIQAKLANERETIFIAQYQGKLVGWLACISITTSKAISAYRYVWHDGAKRISWSRNWETFAGEGNIVGRA